MLDLDNDGIQDICLGSNTFDTCSSPVNLDCAASTVGGGSDCSEQNTSDLMAGDATVTANDGGAVGPNFENSATSIAVPLATSHPFPQCLSMSYY